MRRNLPLLLVCGLLATACTRQNGADSSSGNCANMALFGAKAQKVCWQVINGNAVIQGDIVLGKVQDLLAQSSSPKFRGAFFLTQNPAMRWPNGRIPYTMAANLTQGARNAVANAVAQYTAKYPNGEFRLIPRTTETDYVEVQDDPGCYSYVGRIGGKQAMGANQLCGSALIHEFGHAYGLFHEQSRPDRDTYIRIKYENVLDGLAPQFDIASFGTYDNPYDFTSIMHYGAYAFSKNGLPTIVRRDNGTALGNDQLTATDVSELAKLYGANYVYRPASPDIIEVTPTTVTIVFFDTTPDETGFNVLLRKVSTNTTTTVTLPAHAGMGDKVTRLTGLSPSTNYEITVQTVRNAFLSPKSDVLAFRTGDASAPPSPPPPPPGSGGTPPPPPPPPPTAGGGNGGSGSSGGSGGSGNSFGSGPGGAGAIPQVGTHVRLASGPDVQVLLPGTAMKPVTFLAVGNNTSLALAGATPNGAFTLAGGTVSWTVPSTQAAGIYSVNVSLTRAGQPLPYFHQVRVRVAAATTFCPAGGVTDTVQALFDKNGGAGMPCPQAVAAVLAKDTIDLSSSDIREVDSLRDYWNIQKLDLHDNGVLADVAALSRLPNLEDVTLEGTAVVDYSGLAGALRLRRLAYTSGTGTLTLPPSFLSTALNAIFPTRGGGQ